jgi:1-acyl-sn-glycerol-3-phosphate acyltransferase/long-chain acyl-CoA synthetase
MYQFQYLSTADLDQSLLARLGRCPREPNVLCYAARSASAMLCRAYLRLYHRLHIVGRENLPARGPLVIVSNHASHLDVLCLLAALPLGKVHHAYPAAAADYFFTSIPRMALSAICINALPFGRLDHVRQSMSLCRQVLDAGHVLIVFPEGTRTTDGKVGAFRRGIGELVAGRNVPVVPCHLGGTFAALPRGRRLPRPLRLTLHIGRPLSFAHRERAKAETIVISNELRDEVIALEGACP